MSPICSIEINNIQDEFNFTLDKDFCSSDEIVVRRSDFKSDRTIGTRCSKCACDINRDIVNKLKTSKLNDKLNVVFSKTIS